MSFIVPAVLLGIIALLTTYLYDGLQVIWNKLRLKKILLDRFPGPPGHWLKGNLPMFGKFEKLIRLLRQIDREYGPVHWMQLGPLQVNVRISDPDYVRSLVLSTVHHKGELYRYLKPWLGNSLLTTEGALWKRNRRLLTPAFHFDNLRHYVSLFGQSAERMFAYWDDRLSREGCDGMVLEMFDNCSQITLDSLLKCAFGQQEGSLALIRNGQTLTLSERHPYVALVTEATQMLIRRLRNPLMNIWDGLYYWSAEGRRYLQLCKEIHTYSRRIIAERRQFLQENGALDAARAQTTNAGAVKDTITDDEAEPGDDASTQNEDRHSIGLPFIDIVLLARDETGQGLSDEEIQCEVDTFMFAGHDTTASGLSWCLYNLARHPEEQQRCREEAQQVLGGRAPSWADLAQLQYLTWTIKESLRITPVVPGVARMLRSDMKLPDGRVVPERTSVVLAMDSIHHDPELWTDPDRFDPTRFSPERSAGRHSYAFIPFSAGPRNCIGQHFAMAEMKTVLAMALQRYRFEWDDSQEEPILAPDVIVRARDGLFLRVKPLAV